METAGAQTLGIVAPHPPILVGAVGGARTEVTAQSARALRHAASLLSAFEPDTIVVSSPHSPILPDGFLLRSGDRLRGDLAQFGAPDAFHDAPGDPVLAAAVAEAAPAAGLPMVSDAAREAAGVTPLDHGVLVPLSFLDPDGRWPLVVLSLSWQPLALHWELGRLVRSAARSLGRRVAFVASGDLSHRLTPDAPAGYSPRGIEFDRALEDTLRRGDWDGLLDLDPALVEAAGECGLRSFVILGGFLEGDQTVTEVLSYEGPWGVGYLTAVAGDPSVVATPPGATPERGTKGGAPGEPESSPVALARRAIQDFVCRKRVASADEADPLLATRAGAFVSLHRDRGLRGCIGTTGPTRDTLGEEIVANAIQAATQDPRFPPLGEDELADLEISVDVLHEAEAVDSMEDLDPSVYGVIVRKDWRRGLLLPDLEGVDTAEEQVAIARRKAGIEPEETVTLERFRVDRYL